MEKKGFVYILKSKRSNKYYLGSTENINKRLFEHNSGKTVSLKSGIPWELIFQQEFDTIQHARKIEAKLKSFKSRSILERIVRDKIIKLGW